MKVKRKKKRLLEVDARGQIHFVTEPQMTRKSPNKPPIKLNSKKTPADSSWPSSCFYVYLQEFMLIFSFSIKRADCDDMADSPEVTSRC